MPVSMPKSMPPKQAWDGGLGGEVVRGGWGWGLRLRRGQRLASCRFLEGHLSWIRCGWIVGFWVGIFSYFFFLFFKW